MLGDLLCWFFGTSSRWCPWELGLIPRTSRVPTLCLYIRVNNHRVLKYLGIGESRHATMQIHTNMNHTVCASLLYLLHHSRCHSFDYLDPQFKWEHYFQQVMSQAILSLLHSVFIWAYLNHLSHLRLFCVISAYPGFWWGIICTNLSFQ